MSNKNIHPDDPRLTAFALGELDPTEHHELERLMADSPEAQAAVREIRDLAGLLTTKLRQEPAPSLTAAQRAAILEAGAALPNPVERNGTTPDQQIAPLASRDCLPADYRSQHTARVRRFASLAAVAAMLVVVALLAWPQRANNPSLIVQNDETRARYLWMDSSRPDAVDWDALAPMGARGELDAAEATTFEAMPVAAGATAAGGGGAGMGGGAGFGGGMGRRPDVGEQSKQVERRGYSDAEFRRSGPVGRVMATSEPKDRSATGIEAKGDKFGNAARGQGQPGESQVEERFDLYSEKSGAGGVKRLRDKAGDSDTAPHVAGFKSSDGEARQKEGARFAVPALQSEQSGDGKPQGPKPGAMPAPVAAGAKQNVGGRARSNSGSSDLREEESSQSVAHKKITSSLRGAGPASGPDKPLSANRPAVDNGIQGSPADKNGASDAPETGKPVDLAKRRSELEDQIKREEKSSFRINEELGQKVETYNKLLKEKRFDEAIGIAEEAERLMPSNPVPEVMRLKAKLAKQDASNKDLRELKPDAFTDMLNDVEIAATDWTKGIAYPDAKKWRSMTENRAKYGLPTNRILTPDEIKLNRSLSREVSVHFENAPLGEVVQKLQTLSEVNFALDPAGLEQEGVNSSTNVSIDVNGLKLTSVLSLVLEPLNLGFVGRGDVVVITNHEKTGELFRLREEREAIAELGTEAYTPIVENPILSAYENPLSTFSVDVDTASYANVRRFLTNYQLPPRDAVRIEELVNYFSYDYPQPAADQPFSVTVDAANCPWNPADKLVRIGVKGKEISRDRRPPGNLVFLVDVSGSMQAENKLPLVKMGLNLLTQQMTETDQVSIVTYSDSAVERLPATNGANKQAILGVVDSLHAAGSTNGAAGIQLAYRAAVEHFIPAGTNRVILCTDGDFNVGVTSDDALVDMIQERARTKVFFSVFGFGMGNLKDGKLEKLADKGNGQYAYVDGQAEARKVFVDELVGTLVTIAKDVKLQVEFNPNQVGAYRLLGYENRMMSTADFSNDKKDAGDVGAGHSVTALYEVVPAAAAPKPQLGGDLRYRKAVVPQEGALSRELLTVKLRYKLPEADTSLLVEYPIANPAQLAVLDDGPGTAPYYSFQLHRLGANEAAANLRQVFGEGKPESPVIQADTANRRLWFRGSAEQASQSQAALARLGETGESVSRDFNWAAAVAAYGLILRDSQYRGQAGLDMVLELATAAKGEDPNGRRQEFIDLVKRTKEIVGRRTEAGFIDSLSKLPREQLEALATVDGKYKNLLRIVAAPGDVSAYGAARDFGRWEGSTYVGQTDLPQGYWVYVYPNWYIWGDAAK